MKWRDRTAQAFRPGKARPSIRPERATESLGCYAASESMTLDVGTKRMHFGRHRQAHCVWRSAFGVRVRARASDFALSLRLPEATLGRLSSRELFVANPWLTSANGCTACRLFLAQAHPKKGQLYERSD